ncbi:unnamed protein product, partial [Sphacelaria rigidula]
QKSNDSIRSGNALKDGRPLKPRAGVEFAAAAAIGGEGEQSDVMEIADEVDIADGVTPSRAVAVSAVVVAGARATAAPAGSGFDVSDTGSGPSAREHEKRQPSSDSNGVSRDINRAASDRDDPAEGEGSEVDGGESDCSSCGATDSSPPATGSVAPPKCSAVKTPPSGAATSGVANDWNGSYPTKSSLSSSASNTDSSPPAGVEAASSEVGTADHEAPAAVGGDSTSSNGGSGNRLPSPATPIVRDVGKGATAKPPSSPGVERPQNSGNSGIDVTSSASDGAAAKASAHGVGSWPVEVPPRLYSQQQQQEEEAKQEVEGEQKRKQPPPLASSTTASNTADDAGTVATATIKPRVTPALAAATVASDCNVSEEAEPLTLHSEDARHEEKFMAAAPTGPSVSRSPPPRSSSNALSSLETPTPKRPPAASVAVVTAGKRAGSTSPRNGDKKNGNGSAAAKEASRGGADAGKMDAEMSGVEDGDGRSSRKEASEDAEGIDCGREGEAKGKVGERVPRETEA